MDVQSVQFREGSKVVIAKPRADVVALKGHQGVVVETPDPGNRAWVKLDGGKLCSPFLPDELELVE
jgi:hypothetical protein